MCRRPLFHVEHALLRQARRAHDANRCRHAFSMAWTARSTLGLRRQDRPLIRLYEVPGCCVTYRGPLAGLGRLSALRRDVFRQRRAASGGRSSSSWRIPTGPEPAARLIGSAPDAGGRSGARRGPPPQRANHGPVSTRRPVRLRGGEHAPSTPRHRAPSGSTATIPAFRRRAAYLFLRRGPEAPPAREDKRPEPCPAPRRHGTDRSAPTSRERPSSTRSWSRSSSSRRPSRPPARGRTTAGRSRPSTRSPRSR